MRVFLDRLLAIKGSWLAGRLRGLASDLERLIPGPAAIGVLLFTSKGPPRMAEITLNDDHADINATVTFLDSEGHETTPDQTPTWTSSDETVATVTVSDDGLSATIAIGAPGVTLIEARETETDETTGGTFDIIAQGTITVQPGEAVIGSIEFTETP